jgi:hypothetical protein
VALLTAPGTSGLAPVAGAGRGRHPIRSVCSATPCRRSRVFSPQNRRCVTPAARPLPALAHRLLPLTAGRRPGTAPPRPRLPADRARRPPVAPIVRGWPIGRRWDWPSDGVPGGRREDAATGSWLSAQAWPRRRASRPAAAPVGPGHAEQSLTRSTGDGSTPVALPPSGAMPQRISFPSCYRCSSRSFREHSPQCRRRAEPQFSGGFRLRP